MGETRVETKKAWRGRRVLLRCALLSCLTGPGFLPVAWGGAGAVDRQEPGAAGANAPPSAQLSVLIYARDATPWNTLTPESRQTLQDAIGEKFQRGTGLSTRALWCTEQRRCDAIEGARLRLELDEPYFGELHHGFSLSSSGNQRSQDFGKVTLLPMSCGVWSDSAVQSAPKRIEQQVSSTLLQPGGALPAKDLARQIYRVCEPALRADMLAAAGASAVSPALTTQPITRANETTGEAGAGPGESLDDRISEGGDEPTYIFPNAESTVILRFGNDGQNR